jgi:predicted GIY-YIG superfamily endonuclease
MSIQVGKYTFDGPYTSTQYLKNAAGVYVIVCQRNGSNDPVDIGETKDIKDRIENHDRKSCWNRNCNSNLAAAVLYTPNLNENGRRAIEKEIRDQYQFPCGVF